MGTGGGRTGELASDGEAKELRFASAEADRENQLFRLEVLEPAPSALIPLRMLIASDLSACLFVEVLNKAPPLLCLLACLAAIFGSTGIGGSSCAEKDFLDSPSNVGRLPLPSKEGRFPLDRFGKEGLRPPAPANSERGRSYIDDAPGDLLPPERFIESP